MGQTQRYKDFTVRNGKTPGGRNYRASVDHNTGIRTTSVQDGKREYIKKTTPDYYTSGGKMTRPKVSEKFAEGKSITKGPTKPARKKSYPDPVARASRIKSKQLDKAMNAIHNSRKKK